MRDTEIEYIPCDFNKSHLRRKTCSLDNFNDLETGMVNFIFENPKRGEGF